MTKTFDIVDPKGAMDSIVDLKTWGEPDLWKVIAKASSEAERWMKSTKAMQIDGVGVVMQVTTQQGDSIAEALTFIPFATIVETTDENGEVTARRIEMMTPGDVYDG